MVSFYIASTFVDIRYIGELEKEATGRVNM